MKTGPAGITPLETEILRGERLRSTILAGLFFFAAGLFTVFAALLPGEFARIFGARTPGMMPPLLFAALGCYGLGARAVMGRLLRIGRRLPEAGRYLNALVETSLPTLILLFLARSHAPLYALLMPPSFVYFIFIILSALRIDLRLCIFTGCVAGLEYGALAIYFYATTDTRGLDPSLTAPATYFSRAMFYVIGGLVTGAVTYQIKNQLGRAFAANQERDRIADLFGQHVSPEVVDRLLSQNTELLSESRHVCMMFLDIRDFTTFSENRKPEEVVQYLNNLFDFMIELINEHHGIINKFLGDGFMAVFGAPLSSGGDVNNAVNAARQIVARVEADSRSGLIPPTRIGIGLHAGQAVTGHVGTSRRKEYTIIGDVVNLAARIEQLNKQYGSSILASESVWAELREKQGEALGAVAVKGRDEAVRIYRLA